MRSTIDVQTAVDLLKQGELIAYPTEGVFGLGCDPHNEAALERLLTIKQRDKAKGLILIASEPEQLESFVDIDQGNWPQRVLDSWPGPVTWLMPTNAEASYLSGDFPTQAVRVSAHPVVQALCRAWGGALVSTSANVSQQPPCLTAGEIWQAFPEGIAGVVAGEVTRANQVSEIRDYHSGAVLR